MGVFSKLLQNLGTTELQVKEEWTYDIGTTISAAPLHVDTTEIYVIIATHEGKLYAFDHSGKEVWVYDSSESFSITESFFVDKQTVNSIIDTPVLVDVDNDNEQEILFTALNGSVHCIDLHGKQKWKYETQGRCYGAPLVTRDDTGVVVIVGSHDKNIYKLSGTGRLLQKQETTFKIENKPTRVENLIVVGGHEGEVVAFDMRLQEQWSMRTEARITAPVNGDILTDNHHHIIIAGSQDGKVYAINMQGETLWTFKTKGAIISAPLIGDVTEDDTKDIIVGSCDNTVYCIDAFGELNWSYETDFWVVASPLSSSLSKGNTQIVAGSYDQKLYILEGQGTYALSFIPGLSGIVNQTGQHANIIAKEAGESKGKKICERKTVGAIVGCMKFGDELFITTKQGKISCFKLVQ